MPVPVPMPMHMPVCAPQEFDVPVPGTDNGPAIVGFGEHIFSNLGSLGAFAAVSEQVMQAHVLK